MGATLADIRRGFRGYGRSPRGSAPTRSEMLADDVVGLSLGGCVTLELAFREPHRVRSLTLVNAFATLGPRGTSRRPPDGAPARAPLRGADARRRRARRARPLPDTPVDQPERFNAAVVEFVRTFRATTWSHSA